MISVIIHRLLLHFFGLSSKSSSKTHEISVLGVLHRLSLNNVAFFCNFLACGEMGHDFAVLMLYAPSIVASPSSNAVEDMIPNFLPSISLQSSTTFLSMSGSPDVKLRSDRSSRDAVDVGEVANETSTESGCSAYVAAAWVE